MGSHQDLARHLNEIITLLKEEKEALIQSDGIRVGEIVDKKNRSIEGLSYFKGIDLEGSNNIMELIGEIDSLQELNLLLTKQALGFQNALLESISKNLKDHSATYSSKGSYQAGENAGLVDQSV